MLFENKMNIPEMNSLTPSKKGGLISKKIMKSFVKVKLPQWFETESSN